MMQEENFVFSSLKSIFNKAKLNILIPVVVVLPAIVILVPATPFESELS